MAVNGRGWWAVALVVVLALVAVSPEVDARTGDPVEVSLLIDHRPAEEGERREVVAQRRANINERVATRLEERLDAIGVRYSEVDIDEDHTVTVKVYGDFDDAVIRGAIIPRGKMELRRVRVEDSPWAEVAAELPDQVQYQSPGSGLFRTDWLYLTAPSPSLLAEAIDTWGPSDEDIRIFPQDQGFRTVRLGETVATESHVESASLGRSPAGDPRIAIRLKSAIAHEALDRRGEAGLLAMVLDEEVVALIPTRRYHRSLTFDLEPPPHLNSPEAKQAWGMQVAGRLSTPMPIRLVELDELQR